MASPPPGSPKPRPAAFRLLWLLAGFALLGLRIIGAFLPLMPTTIFLILAAGAFARSSTRLETWLLDHPRFGPLILAWRTERAIPRRAKLTAAIGMITGYVIFLVGARPELWLNLVVMAFFLACAAYVLSRPEPSRR
jgi:uncharacterized membrane protein YbaN (DUF454 family)